MTDASKTTDMTATVATRHADGGATIDLDAGAVDALSGLLDRFIHSDSGMYPDDDTDRRAVAVAHLIQPALLKLQGF